MKAPQAALAKVARPSTGEAVQRDRLFKVLDELRARPAVWISGPPGCGKTTLVSSYVDARRIACLWYQLDEADADPATFFYYMGLAASRAAPRKRRPLPLLTPEYLAGLSTFALRFFENVYDRFKAPAILVFDNYQEVPADSSLHDIMHHGLSRIPEGINVILVSRRQPPSALVQMQANRLMEVLDWPQLRLIPEEILSIVECCTEDKPSETAVQELYDTTDGWAAGLVLILEAARRARIDPRTWCRHERGDVFNYFASEVFDRTEKDVQDFLLKTAFLPKMTAAMAEALTGLSSAPRLLSQLHRDHYFTERRFHGQVTYQYHQLFRGFLIARAVETLEPDRLLDLRRRAANLLEEAGETEAAVELFCQVADWETVSALIMKYAPSLLGQGRNRILEAWLEKLPEDIVDSTPWLCHWMGACRMAFDPATGQPYFEKAFNLFSAEKNLVGIFLAWSGIVNSIYFIFKSARPLDRWLETLDDIVEQFKEFPSEEVEAQVATSMTSSLLLRKPQHPDLEAWANRALALTQRLMNSDATAQALFNLVFYYTFTGEPEKVEDSVNALSLLAGRPDASPLTRITMAAAAASYYESQGLHEQCLKAGFEGLEISEATGVRVLHPVILGHVVNSYLNVGDLSPINGLLEKYSSLSASGLFVKSQYHAVKCRYALVLADYKTACHHGNLAVETAEEMGCPIALCCFRTTYAYALHALGRYAEALRQVAQALAIAGDKLRFFKTYGLFAQARIVLSSGEKESGLALLKDALGLGKECGFCNAMVDEPAATAALCVEALKADIEVSYVQDMVRRRKLIPDEAPVHLENWPWPLKVYTLGRFELLGDDKPVRFSGKTQKKPIALLKCLIALGGRQVDEARLADALWPETDGDMAHQTLATTLHRLRKLLGHPEALEAHEGRLTLDPRYCWVDAWAFERATGQAGEAWKQATREGDFAEAIALSRKAIGLYRGHFLEAEADESWVFSMREQLRSRHVRQVEKLGHRLEEAGDLEEALDVYLNALEIDETAERIYRRLMICHRRRGQNAEAMAVYNRCKRALSESLGIQPCSLTETVRKSLLA